MKRIILIAIFLGLTSLSRAAETVSVAPFNNRDKTAAQEVRFDNQESIAGEEEKFLVAPQCLEINYSIRSSAWEMKIYTDNFPQFPSSSTQPFKFAKATTTWGYQFGGIVSTSAVTSDGLTGNGNRVSLAWNAEDVFVLGKNPPPGDPQYNPKNGWMYIKDKADLDFPNTPENDESWQGSHGYVNVAYGNYSENWLVVPDDASIDKRKPIIGTTFYLYLQGDFLANADDYSTTIYLDLVNLGPPPGDYIFTNPFLTELNMLGDQLVLPVDVTTVNNVEISSARLLYRKKGEKFFKTALFKPAPREGMVRYTGKALVPRSEVTAGGLEYHFEVNDSGRYPLKEYKESDEISLTVNTVVSQTIGPAGGEIVINDGNVNDGETRLSIPAGALDRDTLIKITQIDAQNAPDPTGQAASPKPVSVFQFSPNGLQFKKPVTLTMLYLDLDGPDLNNDGIPDGDGKIEAAATSLDFDVTKYNVTADKLRVFWYDIEWRLASGQVNTVNKTITTKVNQLTLYALFPSALSLDPSAYRPKERIITPATPGDNDVARFDNLNDRNVTIKIFDITGRKIRSIDQFPYEWNGRDDDGRMVESGVYIYQFKVDGQLISGTIVLAK